MAVLLNRFAHAHWLYANCAAQNDSRLALTTQAVQLVYEVV
jgi:hypothetical protein